MIHIKMDDATIDRMFPQAPTPRSTIIMIKVGGLVLALLLMIAGIAMYFCHFKPMEAYVVGGYGLAGALGIAIWSIIDCVREKNPGNTTSAKPKKTAQDVKVFVKENPLFRETGLMLTPEEWYSNWV